MTHLHAVPPRPLPACGINGCDNKAEVEIEGRVLVCRSCAKTTDTTDWR